MILCVLFYWNAEIASLYSRKRKPDGICRPARNGFIQDDQPKIQSRSFLQNFFFALEFTAPPAAIRSISLIVSSFMFAFMVFSSFHRLLVAFIL